MRPVRLVGPRLTKLAIAIAATTALYINYELYRVYQGRHPFFSPKLEEAGLWPRPAMADQQVVGEARVDGDPTRVQWMNVNGVPVPTLDITSLWRKS